MIDHLTLQVRSTKRSRAFYEKALAPLGYVVTAEFEGWVAFGMKEGVRKKSHLWLKPVRKKPTPLHFAFIAPSHEAVHAFHAAALAAGGKDNGKPGFRRHYHP